MGKFGKIALGTAAVFVGGIWALQAVGSNVESTFAEVDAQESAVPLATVTHAVAPETASSAKPASAPVKVGATMLEQAIFDAFPKTEPTTKAAKTKASQASDFLSAAINLKGHLCAQPAAIQQADASHYAVGCVTLRNGSGKSIYLVNVHTGSVTPI